MQMTSAKKHILKTARNAFARQTDITLDLLKKAREQQMLLLKTPEATAELEVMVLDGGTGADMVKLKKLVCYEWCHTLGKLISRQK